MERISGIYVITNKANGKQYVGQSVNVIRRTRNHFHNLKPGSRSRQNGILHNDIIKFGKESFSVEIIENIKDKDLRLERERYWISKLNSLYPNGYNLGLGGKYSSKGKVDLETLKSIIQCLKNGMSAKSISSQYGISIQAVTDINVGRYHRIEGEDYPIRKKPSCCYDEITKEIKPTIKYCPICGRRIFKTSQTCEHCMSEIRERNIYGKTGIELENELKKFLLEKRNLRWIGKYYGVSDNAIKKKLKKYSILP